MSLPKDSDYIRCSFNKYLRREADDRVLLPVEIYYAETEDVLAGCQAIRKFIDADDELRAGRFHNENDRNTYLMCHTLLRLVISAKLKKEISEIKIISDSKNKPWLQGNQLFFNITHTREALAFIVSENVRVGIDLEKINRETDFRSVIKSFFSNDEAQYIFEDLKQ